MPCFYHVEHVQSSFTGIDVRAIYCPTMYFLMHSSVAMRPAEFRPVRSSMIQRYVHVGQLSDSYMGLVYFSHLKPHFVRRGDLDWGSMAPSHGSCFDW